MGWDQTLCAKTAQSCVHLEQWAVLHNVSQRRAAESSGNGNTKNEARGDRTDRWASPQTGTWAWSSVQTGLLGNRTVQLGPPFKPRDCPGFRATPNFGQSSCEYVPWRTKGNRMYMYRPAFFIMYPHLCLPHDSIAWEVDFCCHVGLEHRRGHDREAQYL